MMGWVQNAPCRVVLTITPWVAFVPTCCVKTAAGLQGVSPVVMSLCAVTGGVQLSVVPTCGACEVSLPSADPADLLTTGQLRAACRKCQNNESLQPGGLGTPPEISPVCSGMFSMVDLAGDL